MTKEQLNDVVKFHIKNLSGKDAGDDTPINELISANDGFSAQTSAQNVFRNFINWTLYNNGKIKAKWPGNWPYLTVSQLVARLLPVLLLLLSFVASAQNWNADISTIKTVNKNNAIQLALAYVKPLDSLFKAQDIYISGKKSMFALAPEIEAITGSSDAFSSITAKVNAMFLFFKTTSVSGIITPDSRKAFNIVPISFGIETNNKFNKANAILETGIIPYYQVGNVPAWLKATKVALFIQGGYKMNWDSAAFPEGGQVDESKEAPNTYLLRLKGSGKINIVTPLHIGGIDVSVVGSGDIWQDLVNHATYYRYDTRVRLSLNQDQHFDMIFQKGSGAPNFNQGEQFGVGLNVSF